MFDTILTITKDVSILGAAFVSITIGLAYFFQESLLYYPNIPRGSRDAVLRPQQMGMRNAEEVYITCEDGVKIHCYWIPTDALSDQSIAPSVIYFHGNAGNIGHRLPTVPAWRTGCRANVLLVEYRGYGLSQGAPSEDGILLDAKAAMRYLLTRDGVAKERIFIFGRSLGGAVALHLAACPDFANKIAGVIVENTFTTIEDMVKALYPIFSFAKWFIRLRWNSLEAVAKVSAPILFVSGLSDELVPPWMVKKLYDSAKAASFKDIATFPGGTHMETFTQPGYDGTLARFIWEVALAKEN